MMPPGSDVRTLITRPKPFLDAARRDWQFATFAWLLRHTGGYPKFLDTTLVLPTPEHFPATGMQGHAGVAALFRRVRDHAGMADWPCCVEPATSQPRHGAAGIRVIRYRAEVAEPGAFIAVFARELARHLVETFDEPAPGGEPLLEPALDVAAVFMGFGVFTANAALASSASALNEGETAHALALFCLARGVDMASIGAHVNPHLRKYLRLAARDLERHGREFAALRAVHGATAAMNSARPG